MRYSDVVLICNNNNLPTIMRLSGLSCEKKPGRGNMARECVTYSIGGVEEDQVQEGLITP